MTELPTIINSGEDSFLLSLIPILLENMEQTEMVKAISKVCCMTEGLFDNRKRGDVSPVTLSPVEKEFVTITSNWGDEKIIFNEFSSVQDLLFPLANFMPSSTSREEAIQSMNNCLQSIIHYSSFLLNPSMLQNSLLLYTEFVVKSFEK